MDTSYQELLINKSRKNLTAFLFATSRPCRSPERRHQFLQHLNRIRIERVIHPSPFSPVQEEPRFFEYLEMKREPRLSRLHRIGKFAHAMFSAFQSLEQC